MIGGGRQVIRWWRLSAGDSACKEQE
jgi:hypothetical protein